MYICQLLRGICNARSNLNIYFAEETRITEIREGLEIYAALDFSGNTVRICLAMRNKQVCQSKSQLCKRFRKIIQGILGLFVSNGL